MQLTVESIREHIPYYLTREQQDGLLRELAGFPAGMNYYTIKHSTELLQGDGWTPLPVIRFETGERRGVKGIVLSNSCDVDLSNRRDLSVRMVFVPIIRLEAYIKLLRGNGVPDESISGKVRSIKEQKITSIFFLPMGGALDSDYIAVLDDAHTIPTDAFWNDKGRTKLFTLSLSGFYLFLLKVIDPFLQISRER